MVESQGHCVIVFLPRTSSEAVSCFQNIIHTDNRPVGALEENLFIFLLFNLLAVFLENYGFE